MKTNTRYKTMFAFIILIILGGMFVMGQWLVTREIKVVKDLTIKNNQAEDLEFGAQLKEQMSLLVEQEQKIKNSFIPGTQLLSFIETLEQLALQSNLKITIDKVDEGEKESISDGVSIHPTTFNLQVVGSYENIISFTEKLSQNEKKLTFDKINMYQSQSEGIVIYTARMTLIGLILSYE